MRVAVRADSGAGIGSGHVMRCLTLALALRKRGVTTTFLCRPNPNDLGATVAAQGFEVLRLDGAASPVGAPGAAAADDAAETSRLLEATGHYDWLIVDHYGLDRRWEEAVTPAVGSLFVLDDLGDRPHTCTALSDPLPGPNAVLRARYGETRAEDLLLGSTYAPVRDEFWQARAARGRPADLMEGKRVVHLYFGSASGGHDLRFTRLIARAFPDLEVQVLAPGVDAGAADEIEWTFPGRVRVTGHTSSMATMLAGCTIATGAPGTTTWERACLGLPAAYLATTANQVPLIAHLEEVGFCRDLGQTTIADEVFVERFRAFLADRAGLIALRDLAWDEVDGRGTERLAEYLTGRAA